MKQKSFLEIHVATSEIKVANARNLKKESTLQNCLLMNDNY